MWDDHPWATREADRGANARHGSPWPLVQTAFVLLVLGAAILVSGCQGAAELLASPVTPETVGPDGAVVPAAGVSWLEAITGTVSSLLAALGPMGVAAGPLVVAAGNIALDKLRGQGEPES